MKFALLLSLLAIASVRVGSTMEEYEPIFAFLLAASLLIGLDLTTNLKVGSGWKTIIKGIANYSYTLYLIHYTIYNILVVQFHNQLDPAAIFWIGFASSNIISLILGYFTESKLTYVLKKKLRAKLL